MRIIASIVLLSLVTGEVRMPTPQILLYYRRGNSFGKSDQLRYRRFTDRDYFLLGT